MNHTAQRSQTTGLSNRAHWKNTILAGLAWPGIPRTTPVPRTS